MSRCPPHCCSGCRDELCEERITQKTKARRIDICSVGPLLEIDHDTADDIKLDDSHSEHEPLSVEEGNCILDTGLFPCPSMDIQALSTISQRLAEDFQANVEALAPVTDYLMLQFFLYTCLMHLFHFRLLYTCLSLIVSKTCVLLLLFISA